MALGNVTIEGAQLVLKNFTGRPGDFNAEGDRNVGVVLPDDLARQMIEDGWPVKQFKQNADGEEGSFWIPASVKYRNRLGEMVNRPPRIVMRTPTKHAGRINRTDLGEKEVEMLDYANIKVADIIIRPYEYIVQGRPGVKAYVQSLFATVELDELELKYSDDLIAGGIGNEGESFSGGITVEEDYS